MKNRIYTALGDFCHLSSREPTQRLIEDLGLDETDRVLLLMTLESELGIFLTPADAEISRYRTVGDLFHLAARYLPSYESLDHSLSYEE